MFISHSQDSSSSLISNYPAAQCEWGLLLCRFVLVHFWDELYSAGSQTFLYYCRCAALKCKWHKAFCLMFFLF